MMKILTLEEMKKLLVLHHPMFKPYPTVTLRGQISHRWTECSCIIFVIRWETTEKNGKPETRQKLTKTIEEIHVIGPFQRIYRKNDTNHFDSMKMIGRDDPSAKPC